FVGLLCCYWPLRLLRYYAGFITLLLSWAILSIYSACSTQMIRNPKSVQRVSFWWFILTLPLALIILRFTNMGITRASGFRLFTVPSTTIGTTISARDQYVV